MDAAFGVIGGVCFVLHARRDRLVRLARIACLVRRCHKVREWLWRARRLRWDYDVS